MRGAGGKEMIFGDLGPDQFFGEMAAIDGAKRSANVTALTKVEVCIMPASVFKSIIFSTPAICERLLTLMTTRLRASNARLFERSVLDLRHRLYAELLRLAHPRHGVEGQSIISPPPLQQDLAARIGCRREQISREIYAMVEEGLAEKAKGGLVILHPKLLESRISAKSRRGGLIPSPIAEPASASAETTLAAPCAPAHSLSCPNDYPAGIRSDGERGCFHLRRHRAGEGHDRRFDQRFPMHRAFRARERRNCSWRDAREAARRTLRELSSQSREEMRRAARQDRRRHPRIIEYWGDEARRGPVHRAAIGARSTPRGFARRTSTRLQNFRSARDKGRVSCLRAPLRASCRARPGYPLRMSG